MSQTMPTDAKLGVVVGVVLVMVIAMVFFRGEMSFMPAQASTPPAPPGKGFPTAPGDLLPPPPRTDKNGLPDTAPLPPPSVEP